MPAGEHHAAGGSAGRVTGRCGGHMKQDERSFQRLVANLAGSTLLLLGLAITAITPMKLSAQANVTAEVVGTVTDAGGSVIPGADVTVVNTATSETRKAQSNSAGDYD